jgi:hypothetical protein
MWKQGLRRLGSVALLALPLGLAPPPPRGADGTQLSWPWALPSSASCSPSRPGRSSSRASGIVTTARSPRVGDADARPDGGTL